MIKFYILKIWNGVTPEPLIGPFKTYKGMLKRAKAIYASQQEGDDIFYVVEEKGKAPRVESFAAIELF